MSNKYIFSLIITIFLVACGQSINNQQTFPVKSESNETTQKEKPEHETEEDLSNDASGTSSTFDTDRKTKKSTNSLTGLKVHYIDVGQADATLFQYKDKDKPYNILYDTGDWRGNEVVNYLSAQGVSFIDLIIISHPDADHVGQLAEIVNTYEVGEVWMSGNESSSQTFQRGLEAVIASGAAYDEPRTGDEFAIGPMDITVLNPSSISGKSNEESISAKFAYGDISFLFTGDADRDAEMEMMDTGIAINADFLQLGHHGSNTSSHPAFIEAVSPKVSVYSAGADNQYGHPHAEIISLIQDTGSSLYGTDVHGTIVVTTDGNDYTVQTKEDGTISPKNTGSASNTTDNAETNNTEKEAATGDCININEAPSEKLQEIIHIGPARAENLINMRPYQTVEGLTKINGIGPSRIDDIKGQGLACIKEETS